MAAASAGGTDRGQAALSKAGGDAQSGNGLEPEAVTGCVEEAVSESPAQGDADAQASTAGERLRMVCSAGDLVQVDALLSSGLCGDLEGRDADHGETALVLASWEGHTSVVERLLSAGAAVDARDNTGLTGLLAASYRARIGVVDCLLSAGADPNWRDNFDQTALLMASLEGHSTVVERLLSAGADPDITPASGQTALLAAMFNNHAHTAQLLLWSGRCHNLEARDTRGRTALHLAAWHGQEDLAEHLLYAGADAKARSDEGHTPLQVAGWGLRMPKWDAMEVKSLLQEALDADPGRFRADRIWPFRAAITCWRVAVNYHGMI